MTWPADEPPQIGQELKLAADADLGLGKEPRQGALFHQPVTYVIDRSAAGLHAIYRTAAKPGDH